MGLFTELLLLPLAPVRGVAWIAERVQDQAEEQLADTDLLTQRLTEIEEAYQDGELSDEARAEQTDEILEELRWVTGERR